MDNLTHSLVGAVMGRMGLKRLSPRAMPAIIIAANLPDIDSFVALAFGRDPLAVHRGFTHGIGGLVTVPFLVVAIILLWEKLRPGKEGSLNLGGLVLASFLAVLSHLLLDFATGYGTRLLEPFSHRWFYGDTLFIVDPWIWIMLILGLEMSWRAERLGRNWTRPAMWAFGAMLGYIGVNAAISLRAIALTRPLVERVAPPRMIVAAEIPLAFWKRRMIWRGDEVGGTGKYDPLKGLNHATLDPEITPLRMDDPRLAAAAKRDRHVRAFLFWSRMPMVAEQNGRLFLTDQRFHDPRRRQGGGGFAIPLDKPGAKP
ncbi:MAG TPA: metal-dependent hydrolase [Sphingomicrobium sp.]|nr:metal-dependent hydrolase [Sphingomicrobium sp.]